MLALLLLLLLLAAVAAVRHHGRYRHVVDGAGRGAAIVGGAAFALGFFGPMIVMPGSNLGPLVGILYTGPLGFVVGLVGGAVHAMIKGPPR